MEEGETNKAPQQTQAQQNLELLLKGVPIPPGSNVGRSTCNREATKRGSGQNVVSYCFYVNGEYNAYKEKKLIVEKK